MKLYDASMTIIIIIIMALFGALSYKIIRTPHGCGNKDHDGHDNIAEEVIEDIIESRIGLDVDLTPGSMEDRACSRK